MNTINSRIQEIINHLDITVYEFSKKMGNKRPDAIYNLLKDYTTEPSPKTLSKIITTFPQINYSWLLTGEGDMVSEMPPKNIKISKEFIDSLFNDDYFKECLNDYLTEKKDKKTLSAPTE